MPRFSWLCLVFLLATSLAGFVSAAETVPGVGPSGEILRLHTDFAFTEGPAYDGQGNLYFSDIPNARIHLLDSEGNLSVFTDQSRHSNGLMFNAAGELVACEMEGQLAAWNVKTKTRRILADGYQGKRFNAPNDLIIDRLGGIYFTDPHYRAPEPLPQGKTCVYYLAADGTVTRLIDDLIAPNGIMLAPDEHTLYVFPSGESTMRKYAVDKPGQIGSGEDFYTVTTAEGEKAGGCDGVTIDNQGNLYLTTRFGIQVVNPAGELLGTIELPEQPANVTFGGPDGKTLYATARTSLYAMQMLSQRLGARSK
ncbi:MAG: SMP-30/gluconolactonase/LRE family protein [Planctomycetales bacterium]|nr:SMP-30/gluconolactonase/LRE family protein [Planctomycetales bacterium]